MDSDQRWWPVFIFTTMALLSIFQICSITDSFSAIKMSQRIRTVSIITRERMNQQTDILLGSCTILFCGCIQIISQALSFFNMRHNLASPLTFTLSDLKIDMTLKYWSGCSPKHGLRVVQVITEMQNGKAMPFIKQNTSRTLCRAFCRSNTVVNVPFNIKSCQERSEERFLSKRGLEALLHTFSPRLSLKVRECLTDLVPSSDHALDHRFLGLEYYVLRSNR